MEISDNAGPGENWKTTELRKEWGELRQKREAKMRSCRAVEIPFEHLARG